MLLQIYEVDQMLMIPGFCRKMFPRWTDHVRVTSESLLEGTHEDGYSWRKYGQKDILGAKYPR